MIIKLSRSIMLKFGLENHVVNTHINCQNKNQSAVRSLTRINLNSFLVRSSLNHISNTSFFEEVENKDFLPIDQAERT